MDEPVTTIKQLVTKLGGPTKAAEILGVKGPQRVVNWQRRGKITPDLFMKHKAVLDERGIQAPASFWFGEAS